MPYVGISAFEPFWASPQGYSLSPSQVPKPAAGPEFGQSMGGRFWLATCRPRISSDNLGRAGHVWKVDMKGEEDPGSPVAHILLKGC